MTDINLNTPGILKLITTQVKTDIDNFSLTFNDGHRNHLGASLIGKNCSRYLWYVFRWVEAEKHEPRLLRLFNRGHREEAAFIRLLRGAGFKVWEYDLDASKIYVNLTTSQYCETQATADYIQLGYDTPDAEKHIEQAKAQGFKFKQFRVSDCKGHFGGSKDGIIEFPKHYGIEGKFLTEFKTNGTGAGFNKLNIEPLINAKPEHWAQQCVYGYKDNHTHSLYMNVNKNDDSLFINFIKLDLENGKQLIHKAEKIIFSQKAPEKYSLSSTHFECKYCSKSDICHNDKPAEKNCRSCLNAVPVDNAEWLCKLYNQNIPSDFIKQGCDNWIDITKQ